MIQAVIQGLVQGLAEFLPISSSGHLIIVASIYKLVTGQTLVSEGHQDVFFDIMLHLMLIAILIYFRNDIKNLLTNFFISVKNGTVKTNQESKFVINVMLGTIATIVVFLPFKNIAETLVDKPAYVGIALMIAGTVMFSTEFISSKFSQKINLIDWKESAVAIGTAQALAGIFHGLSRLGMTISTGLATGLERVTAARFSFLLSIPIILLAVVSESLKFIKTGEIAGFNWSAILVGTIIAGVVGYYCVKYFIKFLGNNKLNILLFIAGQSVWLLFYTLAFI